MPDEIDSQVNSKKKYKNENDDGRKIAIALLFLLFSFGCIFCSSQWALWVINEDHVEASILSGRMADYGADSGVAVAPLDRDSVATEVYRDNVLLQQTVTTSGIGGAVVMLMTTPSPSPTPVPPIQALPTLTPTTVPLPSPTVTAVSPPTVELPPTATPTTSVPVPPSPTGIIPTPTEPAPTPTGVPTNTPALPTNTPAPSTNTPVPSTSTPIPTPTFTPVPPTVFFGAAGYSVNESVGTATIVVMLSAASSNTVTVDYATGNGSAIAPGDYTATGSTLTFAPGITTRTFTVTIIDDAAVEFAETFGVTLSNPVNATLSAPNPATVTIIDNDLPTVQFDNATYSVGEDQGTALITVILSASSPATITVDYGTSDGTATAGNDYGATSGTLTFLPGQTSLNFTVPITDDIEANEFTETVNLTLSNPANAVIIAPNPATLEIVDDDPKVEFSAANYTVVENAGTATITVTLSAVSTLPVTVTYTSSNGSAIANSDYVAVNGTLIFDPGDTIRTFTVTIINDAGAEVPETLTLDLSNPVNATLGATRPATLTITDDGDVGVCNGTNPTVDIGPPDCKYTSLNGDTVVITLPVSIEVDGDPDFDLVYYEREAPAPNIGNIALDGVSVWVGTSLTGPWVQVFNWGNAVADTNTNIGQAGYVPPEQPDQLIPLTSPPLYRPSASVIASGIAIDIDVIAPAGTYTHVQLIGGGTAEVDSIDVIP